ncbi:hypothetical protein FYJ43_03610 [Cutibacterium sp. WCA-380-WT-3A]|uniref:Uncharacterized protein n=1 Tax=Cutibacterium porci TaxID=2605781 RepID=A0A7K0J5C9_9ACTN|nr:hypothetical protein [Cutibacterium porci]MSS45151.1 hypothetical protein [Cutibacterium porci]
MTPDRQCWEAVAAVLTGQRLTAPTSPGWRATDLVAWLAEEGWSAPRLVDRRARFQQAGQSWPEPIPDDLSTGLEFARYGAVLAEVRRIVGLDGLSATVHRGAVVIGPDEARLLAERPPHSVLH